MNFDSVHLQYFDISSLVFTTAYSLLFTARNIELSWKKKIHSVARENVGKEFDNVVHHTRWKQFLWFQMKTMETFYLTTPNLLKYKHI